MKYYAQITELCNQKWNPETHKNEVVKTHAVNCRDWQGVVVLDGRLSLKNKIKAAKVYIDSNIDAYPSMSGFKIYKASNFSDTTLIYEGKYSL